MPAVSEKVTVAIVVAGQFGDRSFYDSSKEGAEHLAKEFGVKYKKFCDYNLLRRPDEMVFHSGLSFTDVVGDTV